MWFGLSRFLPSQQLRYNQHFTHKINTRRKDLRRVEDVGADSTQARHGGESLKVELSIGAGSSVVAAKVGTRIAAVATLRLVLLLLTHRIADKHTKALKLIE